jgi:putative FmdB family regulatory protein
LPIYEYRCKACGRRSQIFFRSFSSVEEAHCPHCQSTDVGRIPSRVATVKSESSYQDFLTDPSNFEGVDYDDPKSVAQWAQKIGEAAGVDVGPEYQEMMQEIQQGDGGGDADFGGTDDLGF